MSRGPRLVVIDMQRIFASGPWGAPRFADALPVARRLVDAFDGGATTFTRFVAPEQPNGAWQAYYREWPFALQPPDAPDYALASEFDGSATVDAATFGKWPAIRAAVDVEPGDDLVVCGVSTDCCVLSTVLAAADDGMFVRVVADACAGVDDAAHRRALDAMALYAPMVQVVDSAAVLTDARAGVLWS